MNPEPILATAHWIGTRDFRRRDLLGWLYVGRTTLTLGFWLALLVVWPEQTPEDTRLATLMVTGALAATGGSFWYTHILGREPGENFLYGYVVCDVALVTAIVHIMGDPTFVPTYIVVITEGALLLPLPGGVLIGALASIAYFADQLFNETLTGAVSLQIVLFAIVAFVTGWLGDRVRATGLQLGEVESELQRLRLDTGDILGSMATGVLTVDPQGRLAYMNRAAQDLLRLDAGEWENLPVLTAVEGVSPGLAAIIRRTIDRKEPATRFKSLASAAGKDLTLGVTTTVLEHGDEAEASVTAIFQDITDLERLESLNRRNERLEAVAELSASLAHEIKNPLASIRSSVEQMSAGTVDEDDKQLLQRLIMNESDRLSRLLSDFLEFSVMKLGERAEVDLSQLVCDGVSLVHQHPDAEDGPRIEVQGIDRPVVVPGDQDLLHRLVFNLVLNAVQFAGAEGRVVVDLRDASGHSAPAGIAVGSPVRITVEDSGPGVPDEIVGRIFDPFYTTRDGGSGLGLALVHRAVEAHEGALLVDSGVDGGAKFTIYLPGDSPSDSVGEAQP